MQIVHRAFNQQPVQRVKRVNPDHERAVKRLAIRRQKDLRDALIEFADDVAEIRAYQPGWMPGDKIK